MRAYKIVFLASTVITLTDLAFVSGAAADGYEHPRPHRTHRIHHEVIREQPVFVGYPRFPVPFFWWWCGFDSHHGKNGWCGGGDDHQHKQMMKEVHHKHNEKHHYGHDHDHDHYAHHHDHDHYGDGHGHGHGHDHYGGNGHDHYGGNGYGHGHGHYVNAHNEHGWHSGYGHASGHGWNPGHGGGSQWSHNGHAWGHGWNPGHGGGSQWSHNAYNGYGNGGMGGHGGGMGGHGGGHGGHGGKGHEQTAKQGGHHNGSAAVAYIGASIGCSAVWLLAEGAYTAATEHRDLTYAEAYSTAGGCLLPIIGSYLGYELGKQTDICVANKTCPGMANNP